MKIISGLYKGRNLIGFDIDGTRPTMDRVKESLFAIIQNNIKDSVVLDLFSGSGNLGIEALSNGASKAYLVDKNYKACNIINKNIRKIGIENAYVINNDFSDAIKSLSSKNIKFNLIFLDPPYKTDFIEKSIVLINKYNLLSEDGIIICESDDINKIVFPDCFLSLKNKKYGDKWVVILKKI